MKKDDDAAPKYSSSAGPSSKAAVSEGDGEVGTADADRYNNGGCGCNDTYGVGNESLSVMFAEVDDADVNIIDLGAAMRTICEFSFDACVISSSSVGFNKEEDMALLGYCTQIEED